MKLSDTQAIILTAAAQRESGSLYPLPETITAPKAMVAKAVAALLKHGLAEERATTTTSEVAREEGDERNGYYITIAGQRVVGLGDSEGQPSDAPDSTVAAPRTSKAAQVLALLQRDAGATLAELIDATGWLPHTTRAALTGLRKKGHAVTRDKRNGVTCYRVAA